MAISPAHMMRWDSTWWETNQPMGAQESINSIIMQVVIM